MFSLKEVIDDADLPPFRFEGPDGTPCELPHLRTLTTHQALRIYVHGELEEVLAEVAPDVADMLLGLPIHALDALTKAWMEHSDVEPGKLPSSSRSSASTGGRSKRISRSGGSHSRR